MTPLELLKLLTATAQERADFIDAQLLKMEQLLKKLGGGLAKKIIDEFLNQLDTENGIILSTEQNMRKTALAERAYKEFIATQGRKIAVAFIEDIYAISGLHEKYFAQLIGMKIDTDDIKTIIEGRLGINEKGELKREGFMHGLMDQAEVQRTIVDFTIDKTIGGTGYEDLRTGLKELIEGDEDKMGKFGQFYRNAAYDTYAKIDALNGKLYADKLDLRYFIYAGTRRKASRHFCIHKKGKVFSDQEALKWKDEIGTYTVNEKGKRVPAGPIVITEDIPTYNPFVDRGGYGCVDDIMWISEEIAFARRPDLRKAAGK